jgi:DNA-binding response OmpR family regulator
MLTGQDSTEDKVKGLNVGADDYLTKPFSISELEARIRALLRRPKDVIPTMLEFKDLTLDLSGRKLYRREKEIPLSLKEFGILEYLIRNGDRVVQRDQILSHVWDFEFNSFSNIIDVHIANLRKKIRTPGNNYIETVRGVGYRLVTDS